MIFLIGYVCFCVILLAATLFIHKREEGRVTIGDFLAFSLASISPILNLVLFGVVLIYIDNHSTFMERVFSSIDSHTKFVKKFFSKKLF